jgi:predicted metal-dependent peptidase
MAKFDGWGAEGKKETSVPEPVRRRAERNVFEALARAKMLMPYTAAFLDRMQPIASTRIETLAVSPDLYLIYNPTFFENFGEAGKGEEGMGLWEFGVTFLHESLHVVYKHFSRWDVYQTKLVAKGEVPNHGIWNKAGDCEINSGLIDIEPINPIKQRMFTAIVTDLRAGRGGYGWSERSQEEIKKEARRRADQAWRALPPNEQYPASFPN